MEVPIFVYAKDGKIKVLGIDTDKQQHDQLLADGWILTHSMDACRWIENLHNDTHGKGAIADEVASLSSP